MIKKVRIGCASGFYGDSQLAAKQLVEKGNIDYLVFDYLAEVTMAILARAKAKDENLGYAVDFVSITLNNILKTCAEKGIKIVANAGGVNVPACIAAIENLCEQQGIQLKVAGIYGDDLSADIESLRQSQDFRELQTHVELPEKLASINAYLGAEPIAEALRSADIIVTGRVVDSAVVIGPLVHEFGWNKQQYDLLAQAALAGHIIECGAQCTGGNFTDWHLVPDFSNMSYPIVEVSENGDFSVQIAPETGGMVTPATVAEQIVYEIGDPANYLLPDVTCDFTFVQLKQIDENCVLVSGAKGFAPSNQYKVCATYVDSFKLMGQFFMGGINAADKARANLNAWVKRTENFFEQQGWGKYRNISLEMVGAEDTYGKHARTKDTREVMAKFSVHHDNRQALAFAASEIAYLATSAAPGMSGFGTGRPKPQPLMRIHSTLIDKGKVPVTIQLGDKVTSEQSYITDDNVVPHSGEKYSTELTGEILVIDDNAEWVELHQIAYARSGDKGDNANIGVIARKPEYVSILYHYLTADRVAEYFSHLVKGDVKRFELPGINGFNFYMTQALGGGGTASLQIDSQGKAYAQMLLSMRVPLFKK